MSAALLLASAAKADALGVPEDKRVYLRGFGYAEDPAHVADHPDLWRSPAMATASSTALSGAGIGIDDVAHFDLYSCFASSVNFALDALGLSEDDPRGGDPDGRTPLSRRPRFQLHDALHRRHGRDAADDPGSFGVTSGVGMHMQKHAYGLWSTAPGVCARRERRTLLPPAIPAIVGSPEGTATVATYSVLHGRSGEPESAVLVCDLPGGGRCYARLDGGDDAWAEAEATELIGRTVTLTPKDGLNLARNWPEPAARLLVTESQTLVAEASTAAGSGWVHGHGARSRSGRPRMVQTSGLVADASTRSSAALEAGTAWRRRRSTSRSGWRRSGPRRVRPSRRDGCSEPRRSSVFPAPARSRARRRRATRTPARDGVPGLRQEGSSQTALQHPAEDRAGRRAAGRARLQRPGSSRRAQS